MYNRDMRKTLPFLTMPQIAEKYSIPLRTVQQWRVRLTLGEPFGRSYLLTQGEAKLIAESARGKPGNPNFDKKRKGTNR